MRNTQLVQTYTNKKVEELENIINEKVTFDKVANYYHINFKVIGSNYVCKCPFHIDAGESLTYNTKTKEFKCSVCRQTGGIFKFVQLMENCTENETYAKMCEIGGISNESIGLSKGERINARVELCARSGYSLNGGVGSVKELVESAKVLGITALALCDDYSTNGFEEFSKYCKSNGIDAIYGTTINVDGNRIALLAKNRNGIKCLNLLISNSTPAIVSDSCQTKYEELTAYKKDLISIAILDNYENLPALLELYDYIGVKDNGQGYPGAFFANKNDKRIVAISDSYYLVKQDRLLHDSLKGSVSSYYKKLRNRDELLRYFPVEWVENNPIEVSNLIDDDCFDSMVGRFCVPDLISGDDFRALIDKCAKGKISPTDNDAKEQLDREVNAIILNEYQSLYYIYYQICDLLNKSKVVFSLRGTAPCSLVNYVLGISNINPISWKLHAETFMGFDLEKFPDIDLNVPISEREKCVNQLIKILGKDNVVKAGVVCNYFENQSLELVLNFVKTTNAYYEDVENTKVFKLTTSTRCLGTHPGGLLIKDNKDSFYDHTPIKRIEKSDKLLTSMNDSYKIGDKFPKIDILSHVDMDIANELKRRIDVSYDAIPFNDEVMSLFNSNEALKIINPVEGEQIDSLFGISEFGTDLMREIINLARPKTIEDLVKISGFAHGTGTWANNAEYLLKQGFKLENLIGTRDDIYDILTKQYFINHRTAFSIMEDARKGRGIKPVNEKILVDAKVPNYFIWSIKRIKYLFPRAHCITYTITALKQAYCKLYYPIEFYETVLNLKYASEVEKFESFSNEELEKAVKDLSLQESELRALLLMTDAVTRGYLFEIKDKKIRFYKGDLKDIQSKK